MAFITVSGEPGCRHEELARMAAQRLECELVTEPDLAKMIAAEFGDSIRIPDQAWRPLTVSILASLGAERHVVSEGLVWHPVAGRPHEFERRGHERAKGRWSQRLGP